MAYALVGSLGTFVTGTTSVSPTFGQSPTKGNLLILWMTDSHGWGFATGTTGWNFVDGNGGALVEILWKIAAGADTAPTLADTSATFMAAQLGEFSGNTSTPQDQWGSNNIAGTSVTATATGTDSSFADLIVGACMDIESKSGTTTITNTLAQPGNTLTQTNAGTNGATSQTDHTAYSYALASTSVAPTGADTNAASTSNMNATNIWAIVVSFLASGVAPSAVIVDPFGATGFFGY